MIRQLPEQMTNRGAVACRVGSIDASRNLSFVIL
jgi:hypothetical protein